LASSFAWLDYSERERRQVRDVLDLFREQETRDELVSARFATLSPTCSSPAPRPS